MRELPRDLVTILRTEAKNQRTPPIDYVIAEDGGRMVHTPDPDIAMAELLEEAASALAEKEAELAAQKTAWESFNLLAERRDAERDELLAALAGSISVDQRFQKARMFSTSEVSTLNAARSLIERIKGIRDDQA